MQKALIRILIGLGSLAAWLWGVDLFKDNPGTVPERAKMLALVLSEKWQAVALISLSSAAAAILAWEWLRERRYQRRFDTEIERAKGLDWRETDAGDVIAYIGNQSAWAWKQYARLNFWEFVDARAELRRAARRDEVRLSGEPPNSNQRLKPIPSGYWRRAEISEIEGTSYGTYASLMQHAERIPGERNLYHLRVATIDVNNTWPRAGVLLRFGAPLWVFAKKHIWYRLTPDVWAYRWHQWRTIRDNVRDRTLRESNVARPIPQS